MDEGLEILLSVPERAMQLCDFLVLMLPKMLLFKCLVRVLTKSHQPDNWHP